MRLFNLGQKLPVAAELEWQLARDQRDAKRKLKHFKRKWYGRVVGDGGDIALGEDLGNGDKSSNVLCGAALVALAAPQAFVFHSLPHPEASEEEPEVWICGIRDGLPLHGFDAVLPVADARAKYNEFVSFNSAAQVYGTLNEAKESLEELFAHVPEKARKNALMVRSGISSAVLVVLMGLPVALAALAYSYYEFEEARARDRLTFEEMVKRQAATAAQKQRMAELRQTFDAEVATKRFELQMLADAPMVVDNWIEALSTQVPLSYMGWRPVTANCAKITCTLTWRPDPQALPNAVPDLPGKVELMSPTAPTTSMSTASTQVSNRQLVGKHFDLDLMSWGKAANSAVTMSLKGDPRPVQVSPAQELAQTGVAPVHIATVGSFAASFSNLVALREFARWVGRHAVVIDKMEAAAFAPGVGTVAYHIEGRYVVEDKVPPPKPSK